MQKLMPVNWDLPTNQDAHIEPQDALNQQKELLEHIENSNHELHSDSTTLLYCIQQYEYLSQFDEVFSHFQIIDFTSNNQGSKSMDSIFRKVTEPGLAFENRSLVLPVVYKKERELYLLVMIFSYFVS